MKTFLCFLTLMLIASCDKTNPAAEAEYAVALPKADMLVNLPEKSKPEEKIIRESNLRFETSDLELVYNQVLAAVKKYGASIQNDSQGKDEESVFRDLTIRVPNKNFDAFLESVGKDVRYFDTREISQRNVTEAFIDAEARLKTKKVLEARYIELLKKAVKVSEILEIEKQLSTIREEIEAKEGTLKYLQNQVELSTVTLSFYKKIAAKSGVTVSYASKMGNALRGGFYGISSFFLGLLYIWPFIIILVVLIYGLRKKFRKKKNT